MKQDIEYSIMPDIKYVIFRKCTPSWSMPEQVVAAWNLSYLIAGDARYTIDGKVHSVTAGDLLCLSPGTIRAGVTFPDRLMHCFSVDFELKRASGEITSLPFPIVSHIGCKKEIIHLFHELTFSWLDQQPGYTMKIRGFLLLILNLFFELSVYNIDSSSGDFRIKNLARYIAKHYSEKLSVEKMAAMVDLNTVYFGALFKRETGLTMKQYIAKTRIRNAENLLRSGEYKVGEVAERCGYSDIYHFYKQFKTIMGVAPSQCIPKKGNR
jgi:AraC-like DNA-binding protein